MRCEAERNEACSQTRPLVSVAVPCYNQEAVLPETLNSLVKQDYDPLEIIVSDDASVDGTGEIARDYARRFPGRVTYWRQPRNLGVTGNVRAMRPLLRGDLICWFAGDDLCLPGKITEQVAALAANPQAVACYHDVDVFDGTTGQSLYRYNDERKGLKARAGHIARDLLIDRCFIGAISVMVCRCVAEEVQHRAELPRVSDWLYLIEIAHRGEIIYIDKVLARYRRHKSNATSIIDLTDEATGYSLVRELYPEYAKEVEIGLRRLYASYALRHAAAGNLITAFKLASRLGREMLAHPGAAGDVAGHMARLVQQRLALLWRTGRLER